jgi:hypothetical protein
MSVLEIQQMPRREKLRLMEALWAELSREDAEMQSPAWHGEALHESGGRLASGADTLLDWEQAKEKLRAKGA